MPEGKLKPARNQPLSAIRIVELSAFVAAPLCGSALAALGAEVVRVDPLGGGIDANRWPLHAGKSLYWAGLNQGKKSVTIDTRLAQGREVVESLVAEAGILITNLPVQTWNSYESLCERRPDLIMAVLTGNPDGSTAVDYTVNAAVGIPWVTGPESAYGPVNHVLPAWDALAGWVLATGILAAERRRSLTGEGQLITLSLLDVALATVSSLGFIGEAELNPEARPRLGNYVFGSYARDFRTQDGHFVMIAALTSRQWTSLVAATGINEPIAQLESRHRVDLRDEGSRFELRVEISRLIEEWTSRTTLDELRQSFVRHGVLWSQYQTFKDLVANDARCSTANPIFSEVEQPGIGKYLRAGSPLAFSDAEHPPASKSPTIGQDTKAVLTSWLGYGEAELRDLEGLGVIRASD